MAENGLMEELSVSVELYVPPEVTSLLRKVRLGDALEGV